MKTSIRCIKGDILEIHFLLNNITADAIDDVFWTCKGQGICVHTPYWEDDGTYILRLTGETTIDFHVGMDTYDLTVKLNDGELITVIQDGVFTVTEKINRCSENY